MHYYTSGIEPYHEEHAEKIDIIGGYRLAVSYKKETLDKKLCDISHRPQVLFEGNHAERFLTEVLGVSPFRKKYQIIHHHYVNQPDDIDTGFFCAYLGEDRYYMILDAIYDNQQKDNVVNWMADVMLDDMTFTLLKDVTLLAMDSKKPLSKPMQALEKEDIIFLNLENESFVAMENDHALDFWNAQIDKHGYNPVGIYQYERQE